MRSLLVFLHLVVIARLTEGVPVPVNDILECVSHGVQDLEHCLVPDATDTSSKLAGGTAAAPAGELSGLSNGQSPASGSSSLSGLTGTTKSTLGQGSSSGLPGNTSPAVMIDEVSNLSKVATSQDDFSGIIASVEEDGVIGDFLLGSSPNAVSKITTTSGAGDGTVAGSGTGAAGRSGRAGGYGGSGSGDASDGSADNAGDGNPVPYAQSQYAPMNRTPSTPVGTPDSTSSSSSSGTDPREDSSNPSVNSNVNEPGFHSPSIKYTPVPASPSSNPDSVASSSDSQPPSSDTEAFGYSSNSPGYSTNGSGDSVAVTGYPATFNTNGGNLDPNGNYPNAPPSPADSDYVDYGYGTSRDYSGTGRGSGSTRGAGTGSGLGGISRVANTANTCDDAVACTDIDAQSDVGKVAASPTVDYASASNGLAQGIPLPEVQEKQSGCPDEDIDVCVDGAGSGRNMA